MAQGISCLCPTFGRPELLAEAVESFIRQDYPERELIVLNDAPWQTIRMDAPGVTVHNLTERIPTMGGKWNALVDLAAHDVLMPWPDDDIMLPWACRTMIELLRDQPYVHPRGRHAADISRYKGYTEKGAQGIIAFTRQAWEAVGGYPAIYGGQDTAFLRRLRNRYGRIEPQLSASEAFFIYRWRGIRGHLSGKRDVEAWDRHGAAMQARSTHGEILITPRWDHDYDSWAT